MNSSEMPRSKNYTGEVLGLHFTASSTPSYVTTSTRLLCKKLHLEHSIEIQTESSAPEGNLTIQSQDIHTERIPKQ